MKFNLKDQATDPKVLLADKAAKKAKKAIWSDNGAVPAMAQKRAAQAAVEALDRQKLQAQVLEPALKHRLDGVHTAQLGLAALLLGRVAHEPAELHLVLGQRRVLG